MKKLGNKKIIVIIIILFVAIILSYVIPTLARYKNRNIFDKGSVWSGQIASSYRSGSGTVSDPYIISNAEELAYLAQELNDNDYEDTYFKLSNNIIINAGEFDYNNQLIQYHINGNTYYVNNGNYYDNNAYTGDPVGTINIFSSLNNFKGVLNGNNKIIYGFYSDSSLFSNLSGNISNLYVENAFINTSGNNAIFADSISDATITNVLVDGTIISPVNNSISNNDLLTNINASNNYIASLANIITDTNITNCINHANINGSYLGSGLINVVNDSTITNSYNTGIIDSSLNTTFGIINGNVTISNTYTSGVNDHLIGILNNATLDISNSFMINNNTFISDDINSSVTANNNYYVYSDNTITGMQTSISNLINSNFLSSYPVYSNQSSNNLWIFDGYNIPVLYFDDIVTHNAYLHISNNTWNSYTPIVNTVLFNSNILFAIDDTDLLNPLTKYYYISNSTTVLDYNDLANVTWEPYLDVVSITNEGSYIIYVKTVDGSLNTRYFNSDILVLDKTNPVIDIIYNNNHYNTVNTNVVRTNEPITVNVSASDTLTGIKELKYYSSAVIINDLTQVPNWLDFSNQLNFTMLGNVIVYVKAVDNAGNISYSSTPLIKYNGYVVSNYKPLGLNSGATINKHSSYSFNIVYNNGDLDTIDHYLVSNVPIPTGSVITMKTNNKVYENTVSNYTNCLTGYYCYPLTSFIEVGRTDSTYYTNGSHADELFNFVIDFSGATISSAINNIKINMVGINNGETLRLPIDYSGFSINNLDSAVLTHTISTTYNSNIIVNSNNTYEIPISSVIDLKNNQDTTYHDKKIGLELKFIDSNQNIVPDFFKNMIVAIDNQEYYPDVDNVIRISLNRNTSINKTITITTSDGNNITSSQGYLSISGYASYDGLYNPLNRSNTILIPYVINDTSYYADYNFDVSLSNDSRIINKNETVALDFDILVNGIANPNIRASLARKTQMTAYNQNYTVIDMQNYTDMTLNRERPNYYYVNRSININNTFTYRINTTNLDRSSYRFAFDLYDGDKKVTTIYKYIIVR